MASASLFCPHCGAAYLPMEKRCTFCQQNLATEPDLSDRKTLLHGHYQILNQIGTGGFGAVYRARDLRVAQRLVAIKQINLKGLKAQEIIEATDGFNRERQFLSSLIHRHLPLIYDYFMDTEHWYLIMEYIDGETLETYLLSMNKLSMSQVRTLSVDEAMDIGLQLCDVLAYLHSQPQPVIFRDLKPSNVMRTKFGTLYLIDFGIARYFKPGKLKDTIPFGSPGYAAPEQYGRAQTTAQADIYSLGALLYYMLSGRDPADSPFHFAPLRLYGAPGLAALEAFIMQMVALDPQDRPGSIQVVIANLQRIRQLRDSTAQRIWSPSMAQSPPKDIPTAGAASYYQPSSAGQQQSQMHQPQAQSQKKAASGIGRRTLLKRVAQVGGVVGAFVALGGGAKLYQSLTSVPNSSGFMVRGSDVSTPQLNMSSVFDRVMANGLATITSVKASPVKPLLAVADQAGNVFILSMTTYEVIYQWQVPQPVASLSWTLDAQYLAIGAGKSVYIWQIPFVEGEKKQGKIAKNPWVLYANIMSATVQTVSWSPVVNLALAISDINGQMRVFHISAKGEHGSAVYELDAKPSGIMAPGGHSQPVPIVTMRWSGSRLYSLLRGNRLNVWDMAGLVDNSSTEDLFYADTDVQDALMLSGPEYYMAVITVAGQINLLNRDHSGRTTLNGAGGVINAMALSVDGEFIFGITSEGIYIWSILVPTDVPQFLPSSSNLQSIDYVVNSQGIFLIVGGMKGYMQILKDMTSR